MALEPEAYVLLTIPNCVLSLPSGNATYNGSLALEYVSLPLPPSSVVDPTTPDTFLVLRLSSYEVLLDPARTITATVLPSGERKYIFHATYDEPTQLFLSIPPPGNAHSLEDIDVLHSVLAEYGDFRGDFNMASPAADAQATDEKEEDLRGRFILVDENNGEVIGALDNTISVREDPMLREKGHENDPVIVELPEGVEGAGDWTGQEVLVRTVPPEDRDWMMKGAVFASHVISGTTTLLTSAMNSASSYYIANSTPSPHATPSTTAPGSGTASPQPSRTLLLLQSHNTRKHLTRIHALSGQAVKVSSKTAGMVEGMIHRVVGGSDKGKSRASGTSTPSSSSVASSYKPPLPPRVSSKAGSTTSRLQPSPPPYTAYHGNAAEIPLPLRKSPSTISSSPSPSPAPTPRVNRSPVSTRTSLALSAGILLSTLSTSSVRLIDAGSSALSAAVTHKYGSEVGGNVNIAAGAARNVVLVYVDVTGMGRRAIVKTAAKAWVKGKMRNATAGVEGK